jgi:hypothetical protein
MEKLRLGAEADILLDEDLVDGFVDAKTMGGYLKSESRFCYI